MNEFNLPFQSARPPIDSEFANEYDNKCGTCVYFQTDRTVGDEPAQRLNWWDYLLKEGMCWVFPKWRKDSADHHCGQYKNWYLKGKY